MPRSVERGGAKLARPHRHPGRAVRGRRRHRCHRPRYRGKAQRPAGPAGGGGEQGGRRQRDRHRLRGESRARRLHAADDHQQRDGDPAAHPAGRLAQLRPQGFQPDRPHRHPAEHPDREPQGARQLDRRVDRLREGAAWTTFIRFERRRNHHPSDRRIVQGAHRHRRRARALQDRRASRARRDGRPRAIHLRQHHLVAAANPRRQAQGPRHHHQATLAARARYPDGRGIRRAGLRRHHLARPRRAGQDPRCGDRAARHRTARRARRKGRDRQTGRDRRGAADRAGPAGMHALLAEDIARWQGILGEGKIKLQ